ncbi:MAG: 1-acyl-sn-glycerol-3-phosphate acyltransferase [Anaerolineales bacterium]|nr:1-acyl-sn-glycerol-3-phosphate acyltransferase [Anaerolineales bacterium]
MKFTHWFINFIIRVYTRITCRIDAPDLQKFPMHGPLIAIANHTGQIEVPMLFAHLQPRPLTGWAKVEAWDNWFLNWVFGVWGAIPVRRGAADMKALKLALKALEEGKIFGLAPEGTRNKTGKLIRAMPGTVIIALHSNAPIIPIAHWGGEVYLKNLKRLKRTDFHIRIGEPFKVNVDGVKVTGEVRQQIVDEMMYELAKLLPEEYRGAYSDMSNATRQYIVKVE